MLGVLPEDFFLRRPSLWRRLFRLLIPWFILIALVVTLIYQQLWTLSFEPYKRQSQSLLSEADRSVFRNIGDLRQDVLFLAYELSAQTVNTDDAGQNLSSIEVFFQHFSAASQHYDQVRWIDENGHELVRVDKSDTGVQIIEASKLQNKSARYYVKAGMHLASGEVYFSPLDLNVEHGQIESPIKPVIRVVTPVFSIENGDYKGLIVINYLAAPLLNELRSLSNHPDIELALVNHEGYWLMNEQSIDEWGFMYERPEWRINTIEPALWPKIQSQTEGELLSNSGYWGFHTLKIGFNDAFGPEWKLLVHIDNTRLVLLRDKVLLWSVVIGLVLFSLAVWVCWRLAVSMYERDWANQALNHERLALKESNESLSDSLQKLKIAQAGLVQAEKLSSLGLMVAGVAHELNTPLGAAMLTASGLKDQRKIFGRAVEEGLRVSDLHSYLNKFDEGIAIVEKNLLRGADLVKTFKRLAVDRAQEEKRVFQLSELIEDLTNTSWIRFNKQHQVITTDIESPIEFDSYPGALGRVLENLVNNALMHGYPESVNSEVHLQAYVTSVDEVHIIVSDKGQGIEPDVLSKIFDPFFTTGRSRGGTGLGLHLVHQLVTHLLEGTVTVESELNKGTRVILCLPLHVHNHHH